MKILISNYRYHLSGGPERYMFNLEKVLSANGHDVIPFSIDYSRNVASEYSKYFVSPLGNRDEVYFEQQEKNVSSIKKTLSRLFYSNEVERGVKRLVDRTSPDLAYLLHYLRKLSPSLLVGLKSKNMPIIVRLSDYMMLCPQAHFVRNGRACVSCMPDKLAPSVLYKCVKDSLSVSLINAFATLYHRKKKFFDLIDSFVCTNEFMLNMMMEAGYSENRLSCIPTFTDLDHFRYCTTANKSDYFVYVGRVTPVKGIHILLKALALISKEKLQDVKLKIAGTGNQEYLNKCKKIIYHYGLDKNVEFVGNVSTDKLPDFLNKALFSVVPSIWFENLPNSILESYSCGTPVIASNFGSLAESVTEGMSGFLFHPGDPMSLAEKIEYCLSNPGVLTKMSIFSRQEAEKNFSPQKHFEKLFRLFSAYK